MTAVVVVALLLINVVATVALYRTLQLSRRRKAAQGAFAWCIPFVGASLVLHLLADSDPDAVHERVIPNDTINAYVLQALGVQARVSLDATRSAIEHAIIDAVSSHVDHSDAPGVDSSGGGDGN
ncbi:MAG TPA: hypothetical protein VJ826_05085 [Candidatus Polarisedimenticolaceae bacterium]|nr:hypothetical protein [Candidatus Polarisedimenticolaceae bacterium]